MKRDYVPSYSQPQPDQTMVNEINILLHRHRCSGIMPVLSKLCSKPCLLAIQSVSTINFYKYPEAAKHNLALDVSGTSTAPPPSPPPPPPPPPCPPPPPT